LAHLGTDPEAPATRTGTPFLAAPQHGEPILISALAVAGALTCWACAAPRPGWATTAALVPLSMWAVHPGRPGRVRTFGVLTRALLILAAALTTTLTAPSLSGLCVVWVLATAALYPVILPRQAATAVTSLGVLSPCVPVTTTLLRGDVEATGDPALLAGTVAAAVIVAGLGAGSSYVRAALADAAQLAEQRHAVARSAREELVRMTSSDGLTSLPNRANLLRRITQGLALGDVIGGPLALFVLEIDRFTVVTDTLGPASGDEVLRQVARRLRAAMPAEDLVARIGARRFAVLVEGVGPEGCSGMARRMTALPEDPEFARNVAARLRGCAVARLRGCAVARLRGGAAPAGDRGPDGGFRGHRADPQHPGDAALARCGDRRRRLRPHRDVPGRAAWTPSRGS
jgi:diguanylate cyclase (GGDEF)-like protein